MVVYASDARGVMALSRKFSPERAAQRNENRKWERVRVYNGVRMTGRTKGSSERRPRTVKPVPRAKGRVGQKVRETEIERAMGTGKTGRGNEK